MQDVAVLRNAGLMATLPRLKIIELFRSHPEPHLFAEEIYRLLCRDGADVSLASVYRILSEFDQAGLIRRSNLPSSKSIFELNDGPPHDHLICSQCGHVEDFADAALAPHHADIAGQRGFRLQGHSLIIQAECLRQHCEFRDAACAARRADPLPHIDAGGRAAAAAGAPGSGSSRTRRPSIGLDR